uniref:DUF1995 domain-containing protein n=1 Tax=Panagrellus redivivus TaxID=6233 RepID=A0A7E4VYS5_PANRE
MNGGDLRDANRYFEVAFNAHRACLARMAATTQKESNNNNDDSPKLVPSALVKPVPKHITALPIFKDLRALPNTVVLVAGLERAFRWDRTGVLVLAVGCLRVPDDIADEVYASTLPLWARVANIFIVANPMWKGLRIKHFERLQNSLYVKTGTKAIWVLPSGSDVDFIKNLGEAKCRYTILGGAPNMVHNNSYFEEAWLESEVKEAVRPFLPAQTSKKSTGTAILDLEQAETIQTAL